MNYAAFVSVCLGTFLAMEGSAWLMHRHVMHGWLWSWHEDHHVPDGALLQKNDRFALVYAIPSWLLIMSGMQAGTRDPRTAIGIGILLYGVAYTIVHESIIHRRFSRNLRIRHWYFDALREAHAVHHQTQTQFGCRNFGMLLVPWPYLSRHMHRSQTR